MIVKSHSTLESRVGWGDGDKKSSQPAFSRAAIVFTTAVTLLVIKENFFKVLCVDNSILRKVKYKKVVIH